MATLIVNKKTSKRAEKTQFTKQHIASVIDLWEKKDLQEIADELNIRRDQVQYLAHQIRRAGFNLPKKRMKSKQLSLIREVLLEKRLIRA